MDKTQLDLIINDSLLAIYNSEHGMVYSDSFVDENGINLSRADGDALGRLMEDKGLVKKDRQHYTLTSKAIDIIEHHGGYLKYRHEQKGGVAPEKTNNTINFNGDNYGVVGQGSSFENKAVRIKQEVNPIKNDGKSKLSEKIWYQFMDNKLIAGFLLLLITAFFVYMKWIKG